MIRAYCIKNIQSIYDINIVYALYISYTFKYIWDA